MSYKEKIAWLSLFAMAVTFGPYFTITAISPPGAVPDPHQLGLFAMAAAAQMFILGVGHLLLRRGSPQDARMPPDERDRVIMNRSLSAAYYVLIAGMIMVGIVMPLYASGWAIINAAIFMIIAAEIVHYAMVVVCYRRQA